jgi:transposase
MRAYSLDLRQRVLADCDRGEGTKVVATRYRVSPAWVRRLKQRRRETGEIGPRKLGQPKGLRRLAVHLGRLRTLTAQRPDATLAELRAALGLVVSLSTIWRALRELKLSFKKKRSTLPSRSGPMSPRGGRNGASGKSASTRGGWSSSTRPGRRRT